MMDDLSEIVDVLRLRLLLISHGGGSGLHGGCGLTFAILEYKGMIKDNDRHRRVAVRREQVPHLTKGKFTRDFYCLFSS